MDEMKREVPKGAITTINGLIACKGKIIWRASRKHTRELENWSEYFITGNIGLDGTYYWYEYKQGDHLQRASLLDANAMPNTYNDWYFFSAIEDARAYLGMCPTCGKR